VKTTKTIHAPPKKGTTRKIVKPRMVISPKGKHCDYKHGYACPQDEPTGYKTKILK
jgi:hypothetical protein